MQTKLELYGHTLEIRGSGTGSVDPWSQDFAHSIDVSLMCTSDMAEFMLIDGQKIYKFESFNQAHELHELISNGIFDSWEQFDDEWLVPKIRQHRTIYFGTLDESIESLKEHKRRETVWESIPEKERRGVYEHLKTLSKEETEKWYEDKFKELGI